MHRFFLPLLAALLLPFTLAGADWPRFRGPNGTGIAEGTLPKIDPKAAIWKVPIAGRGVSSPIIAAGKVFVQAASDDGTKRFVICLDAKTGQEIWKKEVFSKLGKTHAKSGMAAGTPAADGERVFCTSWDGDVITLFAYDFAGKELWQQPLGGFISQHGPGNSPAVYNGIVYVNVDEDADKGGKAMLFAFDAKTGDKKWGVPRKPHRASYSTPFILERPGKPAEIVLGTTTAITGYKPDSGEVIWSHAVEWANGRSPLRVVGSPVYANGVIILYTGDGGGDRYSLAIDLDGKAPHKVWELKKGPTPYVPCMISQGELVFWIADNGIPCCANAKTGKMVWDEERLTTKDVTASPILVGKEMLIIAEDGKAYIVKADKTFELLREESLGEGVFASPAMAGGRLYVRGLNHLYCFGSK